MDGAQTWFRAKLSGSSNRRFHQISFLGLERFSTSMASSFETHRFAILLRMRSQTLMVRSASEPVIGPRFARTRWRVSNHEATGKVTTLAESRGIEPPSLRSDGFQDR
jgi:hypothetical protein